MDIIIIIIVIIIIIDNVTNVSFLKKVKSSFNYSESFESLLHA